MVNEGRKKPEDFPAAACPKCGGSLGAPAEGKLTCEYCGATWGAEELSREQAGDSIETLYELGREALTREDYAQAYEYFDKITDKAPAEHEAWLGKGIAGAYKGLLEEGRLDAEEALLRLEKALEVSGDDDREAFEKSAADRLGAAAIGMHEEASRRGTDDETNVKGILDLLLFWEASGSDQPAARQRIVDVAGRFVTAESARPFASLAEKYDKKIREKAEAEAKVEVKAETVPGEEAEAPQAPARKSGRTAVIIIIVVVVATACVLCTVFGAWFALS